MRLEAFSYQIDAVFSHILVLQASSARNARRWYDSDMTDATLENRTNSESHHCGSRFQNV